MNKSNFAITKISCYMPFAIVSVTNDLTTDQRVDRTCRTLVKSGYDVLLVGRARRNSKVLAPRNYRMHRMKLLFDKGWLFYTEYNLTLFFYLLFHKYDLVVSNDLDTLPANFYADRIKHPCLPDSNAKGQIRHLHDCHEYFRGVPELNGRKKVAGVWKWFEDRIFPKLNHVVAVNASVADLYSREYRKTVKIIRNVPFRRSLTDANDRTSLAIHEDQKVIIYQGALNVDRGLEEAILAMKYLKTDAILIIAGTGDIEQMLKHFTMEQGLTQRVRFLGQVPFEALHGFTLMADLGLSIEKDVSINYRFCLPNKFFDYIQANVPVLVSPFPEMKAIVDQYVIGEFITSHDPVMIASRMDSMFDNPGEMTTFKKNLQKAAEEFCWELEEAKLVEMLQMTSDK
jgi:glycosyltransferase involved in cell wall biosynthesis